MKFKHLLFAFKHLLFALLFILLSLPKLEAQSVERGPYIQLGTTSSVIVRWRTSSSTQSKVWYGTNANNLSQMASSNGTTDEHEVLINSLSPATIYYYDIGDNNGPYGPIHGTQYFKTHPEENGIDEPIRAWMLGNAGTLEPKQRDVRDSYYNVIGDAHIDMILFTGDNAYEDGKDHEYQEALFENMYEERLANSISWSCFGNHDAGDADSEDESGTYYDIFNFPRNGQSGGLASGTEAYYSFDYGNMHVISLNTQDVPRETGDDMIVWLEDDLAANAKKWIVTILHHRPYTGSNNNDSDIDEKPTDVREFMLPLLEAGGCDLVLSSHSHNYQRSFLINGHYGKSNTFDEDDHGVDMGDGQANGDGAYSKVNSNIGTVYVVAGTAGQTSSSNGLNHPVMYYNSGSAGSVQLLISDEELNFQFINEDEEVEDYFTIVKTPSTPVSDFKITNPTEGQIFTPLQNITITADTTGTLINVDHVDFYVDNVLIGSDNSAPFSQVWMVPGADDYQIKAIANEATGSNTEEDVVNISSGAQESCSTISSGFDDAEEKTSGTVNTSSSDLELTEDGGLQQVGLRFENTNIPLGVHIDSAYIQFTVDESKNVNPCVLQIYGEKSLAPANYDGPDFNISDRTKTNENITWSPANWISVGDAGAAQRTPNVASVIQELIDQADYDAAEALAFIIEGTGQRVAASYNSSANLAPTLCIYYSPNFCSDLQVTIGDPCNDNNPDTYNDVITANCDCAGTPYDCPILQAAIGSSCNDGNNGTYNDVVTANCDCVGTPYDCPALQTDIGASCDDGNNGTYNDVVTANCDCAGTPYDCPVLQADIGTFCNDGNNGTYNDVVTANCACAGIPYDCPTLQANIGDECDDGNPLTGNDEVTMNCICEGSLLEVEITVVGNINDEDDDAEEKPGGHISLGSSDLELVADGGDQVIGIRFSGMEIPEGAVIIDAYIQFTTDEATSINPCVLTISGEAADAPQTFSNQDFNISTRARTNATATWEPPLWQTVGESGDAQKSANLTSVVQELINRPGYVPGNPMAFIIEGEGERVAESYDGETDKAPKLYIAFVFSCDGDDDNDGVCNDQDLCFGPEPGTPCDDGNAATFNDVITAACDCMGSEIGTEETVCSQIVNDEDDAEEAEDGSVNNGSSDIEMMEEDELQQRVGFRFLNLNIPQGAIIQEASIQFTADETKNVNPCELSIFAEAADNPLSFDESDFNLSSRPRTNASVSWSPPMWTEKGAAGAAEKTADISIVLQEVVNRNGYSENSPVVIMMDGIGKRVADSFEGGAANAANLCVTYSMSTPPSLGMVSNDNGVESSLEVNGIAAEDGLAARSENEDAVAFSALTIFPNPTKGQLNLAFSSIVEMETEVRIEQMNGQLLNVENHQIKVGNNQIGISNLNLPNGMYIVKLKERNGWQSRRFVVLK